LAELGIATQAGTLAGDAVQLRYPLRVVALASAVAALVFAAAPFGAGAFLAAAVSAVLVVVSAIDVEHRIIPNRIVLPATLAVLIARVSFFPGRALEWVLAAILAGAFLFLPRLLDSAAMGMGDVKLAMLIGAALGRGAILAISLALLCTLPVAVAVIVRHGGAARKMPLPFGPFLAAGALLVMFIPALSPTG
jgi:prepilin signal peptidase PulO-like enzyme (type II secretory pathway)